MASNPLVLRQMTIRKLRTHRQPCVLSKPIRNFVTTSSISRLPQQINPMEIMDTAAIITRLGEGAISSESAVPDETRQVNYSYLGAMNPIAAPESSKVGIDNRVTIAAIKGTDNEFYKSVRNTKSGKIEIHRAIELYDKYVGFPDAGHSKPPLFLKWRAVITIGKRDSDASMYQANAHALARYAALCQEAGIVPIVEPEVLMNGDHTMKRCFEVTEQVLHTVFNQLYAQDSN